MIHSNTKHTIGFVQITNVYSESCYFPYTVGVLQAYFQKFGRKPDDYEFLDPIYRAEPTEKIVRKLIDADLVGFSIYMWNRNLSCHLAMQLKKIKPEIIIVFGGPEVPVEPIQFMEDNPCIDIACTGEGEQVFTEILNHLPTRQWSTIQAIAYRVDRKVYCNPRQTSLMKLSDLPSPYLTGVFDSLLKKAQDHRWDGIWETNRGCPFRCAYCCWGASSTKQIFPLGLDRVMAEIRWFAEHRIRFVYLADSNFGILPQDLDIARMLAEVKSITGYPTFVSANFMKSPSTRSLEICSILEDANLSRGVTIGLQTTCQEALHNIGRSNIAAKELKDLQAKLNADKILTYVDMILGLPGETYASFANGIEEIIRSRQTNHVQFNNLVMIQNSRMYASAYRKKFGIRTVTVESLNLHSTNFNRKHGLRETKEIVIGTDSMPCAQWIRARVFAWQAAFLFFNKMLQIPLVIISRAYNISFQALIEAFMEPDESQTPLLANLNSQLYSFAEQIQQGGGEFCRIPDLMDTHWTQDEYLMIYLLLHDKLLDFYGEAETLLANLLISQNKAIAKWFTATFVLNAALLKKPFCEHDQILSFDYDIWAAYLGWIDHKKQQLNPSPTTYLIERSMEYWDNLQDWAKEVVWYQHRLGAYLYSLRAL